MNLLEFFDLAQSVAELFLWGPKEDKHGWLVLPLTAASLIACVVALYFVWLNQPTWLVPAGFGLGFAWLTAEYFVVTRLLPNWIRRPR